MNPPNAHTQATETDHILPTAWTLHQTARLAHFIERCGRQNCGKCGHIRSEIVRRGHAGCLSSPPAKEVDDV